MAVGLMNAPDEKLRLRLDERVQPRYPPVSSTTIQRMGHPLHERYVREPAPALRRRSVHAARCVFRLREHGGSDPALLSALVGDLNTIIQSGNIYDPARFAGVTLSAESNYILGRSPSGSDIVRLNRYLIRDAYHTDFATVVLDRKS